MNVVIAIVYFIQILYDRQLIKAYREFMIFVRYLYYTLHHLGITLMVQHTGDTFPILTDLDQLTNYSSIKLSSCLHAEKE